MALINLPEDQLNSVVESTYALAFSPFFSPAEKPLPALLQLLHTCNDLTERINAMHDAALTTEMALSDRKWGDAVDGYHQLSVAYTEFDGLLEDLAHDAREAVTAFRDQTQCNDYQMLFSDDELRDLIAHGEELCSGFPKSELNDTSVHYDHDGNYLLVFSPIVDGERQKPVLIHKFATGRPQAFANICRHLMRVGSGNIIWAYGEDLD